jgi:hypothetical protein
MDEYNIKGDDNVEALGFILILLAFYVMVVMKVSEIDPPEIIYAWNLKDKINEELGFNMIKKLTIEPLGVLYDEPTERQQTWVATVTFKGKGNSGKFVLTLDSLSDEKLESTAEYIANRLAFYPSTADVVV